MHSVTVKLPSDLEQKLRVAARKRGTSVSDLTRIALTRELEAPAPDFARMAASYRGMFSGPRNLSTREGYGS